jgi:hypothetical protein
VCQHQAAYGFRRTGLSPRKSQPRKILISNGPRLRPAANMTRPSTDNSKKLRSPDGGYEAAAARCSIAWVYSFPARYDDRTSGPASTPANPIARASSRSSTNSSGLTHRSTG